MRSSSPGWSRRTVGRVRLGNIADIDRGLRPPGIHKVEGWRLIILGNAVGFLFAVLVLTLSVVSFPLLLDRDVGPVVPCGRRSGP